MNVFFVDNPEDAVPPPAMPEIETNLPWNLEEVDQQVRPKLEDLLTRYYDKICGTTERPIGRHTTIEVPVPTKADAKPVFIQPRRTAPKLEKFVKEELENGKYHHARAYARFFKIRVRGMNLILIDLF